MVLDRDFPDLPPAPSKEFKMVEIEETKVEPPKVKTITRKMPRYKRREDSNPFQLQVVKSKRRKTNNKGGDKNFNNNETNSDFPTFASKEFKCKIGDKGEKKGPIIKQQKNKLEEEYGITITKYPKKQYKRRRN
jgi:hypothetical protein